MSLLRPKVVIEPKYYDGVDPMYRHNPFVEALGPTLPTRDIGELLEVNPAFDPAECHQAVERRVEAVQRLSNLFVPIPDAVLFVQKLGMVIRQGYLTRNPLDSEWAKQIRSGFPGLAKRIDVGDIPGIRTSASGFSVIGASGTGKSTGVEYGLLLFPQLIFHQDYQGKPLNRVQVVWLKIECPSGCSKKQLILSFLRAVDAIVEGNRYNRFRRDTVEQLVVDMAIVASEIGLGVLVIDEIQRLGLAKSGGAQELLEFLTEMINTVGVPIVMVGTHKVLPVLRNSFAQARRSTGMIWSPLQKGRLWDLFMRKIWPYNWTSKATPCSAPDPEISDVLFERSQGIIDIAIKMYQVAQWYAIGSSEEITSDLINEVADKEFIVIKPLLDALAARDLDRLAKLEDMGQTLETIIQSALLRAQDRAAAQVLEEPTRAVSSATPPLESIVDVLTKADIEPGRAMEAAKQAIEEMGPKDVKGATKRALAIALRLPGQDGFTNTKRRGRDRLGAGKVVEFPDDLRRVVASGLKEGKSPHEALRATGLIKPALEWVLNWRS